MSSEKTRKSSVDNSENGSPRDAAPARDTFPIVGIGASAGGLEALRSFFHAMPAPVGMAFVVVTHQHPGHESLLPELLGKETSIQIITIRDGAVVEPDRVYVLAPGNNLVIAAGVLRLVKVDAAKPINLPIDIFFRSLAKDQAERAVGVVLSGTGADGALGIKEVKAHGGMVMVQKPSTAKYAGMPESAVATGMVDVVEPPELMPGYLINFMSGPYLLLGGEKQDDFSREEFAKILMLLHSRTGHDFSSYKGSTIRRRIERRMRMHGLNKTGEYLAYLGENPPEAQLLFSEMLISVTGFFRDPEAFAALQEKALVGLIGSRPDGSELRVWIPGCATGEEAYGIAIVLYECLHALNRIPKVKIFGTDLDAKVIQEARRGVYSSGIVSDVSAERLARFFTREGEDAYQVRKEIRDMLVFAPQNMLSDPPFTRLDLLVCRNVLIYLQSDLQQKLLPTFHYALNPGGILFLGASESVGPVSDLFDCVDARWKIYHRREVSVEMPKLPYNSRKAEMTIFPEPENGKNALKLSQTARLIEQHLINRFAPISIVIDQSGTIIYIHGRTGAYLEPEQHLPHNNILEMAREGLRLPLSAALHQLQAKEDDVACRNLSVKTNGEYSSIDLCVSRIKEPESLRGLLLVTILPASETHSAQPSGEPGHNMSELSPGSALELERELHYLKENHQITMEELQSTNEELQSSNEELQSTNEELQSSKEEMESLNEEMSTVNGELSGKVVELGQARDDMKNLLNSTDIAVIYLDQKLNIMRFTEKSKGLISLRETDIGRPIAELSVRLSYDGLVNDCSEVLDTLVRKEKEVLTSDKTWQFMRILPYRTTENLISGVVITFVDITRIKEAESLAKDLEFFRSVVQTVREPLIVLDDSLRVQMANTSFFKTFQSSEAETLGNLIYDLGNGQWKVPALRTLLEEVLPKNADFADLPVEHDFPVIGHKKFILNARRLRRSEGLPGLILLALEESR
jgi:two-component system, chemotaxis family, CheB/CheR fusion protein